MHLTSCGCALLCCAAACRSDFDCCEVYKPHHKQLDDTFDKPKAAVCDWNVDLLKEYLPNGSDGATSNSTSASFGLYPVKEGPYLKFGTVTGRCEQTVHS